MKRNTLLLMTLGVLALAAALVSWPLESVAQQVPHTVHQNAGTGQPIAGQITLQNPVTPIAEEINRFHSWVNKVIIGITAFVLILMVYVMFRFREKANPEPSRTTHNAALEVAWTVIPVFILIIIAIPSFRLLFNQYSFPKPDLTIKAYANAWYWMHEYSDVKDARGKALQVESNMITDEELMKAKFGEAEFSKRMTGLSELAKAKAAQEATDKIWKGLEPAPAPYTGARLVRQLSVDNEIAIPVGKVVHLLITSNDVIHSWTIPSFGSKMQAVPGRVTATWFRADKIGVYYGQCSVLCGKLHSSMPIAVRVVSDKDYAAWVDAVKARDKGKARTILQQATAGFEPRSLAAIE